MGARASRTSSSWALTRAASPRRWTPCAGLAAVLEHPADSHAWTAFGLLKPKRGTGWTAADGSGGRSCHVEQGHYGHVSRKPTWLYAVGETYPELEWSRLPQRLSPIALERYGYEKARRIGVVAMIGGKRKTEIRNATPLPVPRSAVLDRSEWLDAEPVL